MLKKYFCPTLLAVFAGAATSTLQAENAESQITETLVVANRISQSDALLAAATDRIDRAAIENSLATDVVELLQGNAGIQQTRNGGAGQNGSLFMRGTDSDHTLILIDGQPVNALADGRARLEFLPLSQIESIEIVRGARSSIYGSEAIGGVISIESRASVDGFSGTLGLIGGENNLRGADLTLGGSAGEIHLRGGLQQQATDGDDARVGLNPDRDGYSKQDSWLMVSSDIAENSSAKIRYSTSSSETEFDDGAWISGADGEDDYDRQQVNLELNHQLSNALQADARLSRSSEHFTSFGLFGPFESDSDRRMINTQLTWRRETGQQLGLVGELQQDRYQSNFLPSGLSRDNTALALIAELGAPSRPIDLSLRRDVNEQYGSHLTGQISVGQNTAAGFFWASYGTAFKAPNFFDLYGFGGDPDLQPEQSATAELGWKKSSENWRVSSSIFQIETDNLIEYNNALSLVFNSGNVRIQGVEWQISGSVQSWQFDSAITWLNHKNLDTGNALLRRPQTQISATIGHTIDKLAVSLSALYRSQADDFGGRSIGASTAIDATLGYRINESLNANLQLQNIFDQNYQTVAGFNQPGRNLRLRINYQF